MCQDTEIVDLQYSSSTVIRTYNYYRECPPRENESLPPPPPPPNETKNNASPKTHAFEWIHNCLHRKEVQ